MNSIKLEVATLHWSGSIKSVSKTTLFESQEMWCHYIQWSFLADIKFPKCTTTFTDSCKPLHGTIWCNYNEYFFKPMNASIHNVKSVSLDKEN